MKNNDIIAAYTSPYGFKITSVASDNISKAHFGDWHYDESLVLAFFKKARGKVKIEGNTYMVSDGDIIILNYNEIHSVELEELPGERISLYLNEKMFDGYPGNVKLLLSPFYKRGLGIQNLLSAKEVAPLEIGLLLEEVILEMSEKNDVSELMAFTAVIRILNALYKSFFSNCSNEDMHFSNPIIKKTIQYINSNYLKSLDSELISREMCISKYHLSKLFKETVGIGLWEYIINRRLFHFNELVKNGHSIQSAAIDSGFNNYSNFYRLYKKHMHISPSDFKSKVCN